MNDLTDGQKHILLALIRKEARTLGYGQEWHEDNRPEWPKRLKEMRIIAGKLNRQLYGW